MEKFIISEIALQVARASKIRISLLHSPCRKTEVVRARNIAIYLAYKKTNATTEEIAFVFNRRSHASILYAIKSVQRNRRLIKFAEYIWNKNILDDLLIK